MFYFSIKQSIPIADVWKPATKTYSATSSSNQGPERSARVSHKASSHGKTQLGGGGRGSGGSLYMYMDSTNLPQ